MFPNPGSGKLAKFWVVPQVLVCTAYNEICTEMHSALAEQHLIFCGFNAKSQKDEKFCVNSNHVQHHQ